MIPISRSARHAIFSCFAAITLLASSTVAARAQKAANDDPDAKEIAAYSLSMDGIRHLAAATSELKEWEQKNPDASKGMDGDELKNAGSITEQAKIFDSKFPQGTAILKKDGFSTREYLISLYAFVQAAMIVSLKKAGQAPQYRQTGRRGQSRQHRSNREKLGRSPEAKRLPRPPWWNPVTGSALTCVFAQWRFHFCASAIHSNNCKQMT